MRLRCRPQCGKAAERFDGGEGIFPADVGAHVEQEKYGEDVLGNSEVRPLEEARRMRFAGVALPDYGLGNRLAQRLFDERSRRPDLVESFQFARPLVGIPRQLPCRPHDIVAGGEETRLQRFEARQHRLNFVAVERKDANAARDLLDLPVSHFAESLGIGHVVVDVVK